MIDEDHAPCPVCAATAHREERHLALLFIERISDDRYRSALRDGGGYCTAHARELLGDRRGQQLGSAYESVLRRHAERLADPAEAPPPMAVPSGCPVCVSARRAEVDALSWLLDPQPAEDPVLTPRRDAPVCARHLAPLIAGAHWSQMGALLERVRATLDAAEAATTLQGRVGVLAGADLVGRRVRRLDDGLWKGARAGWADGLVSPDGLDGELARGRCPLCTIGLAALLRSLGWIADAHARRPSLLRDLPGLCGPHHWEAVTVASDAATWGVDVALGDWRARLAQLPPAPARTWGERLGQHRALRRAEATAGPRWRLGVTPRAALDAARPQQAVDAGIAAALRRRPTCVACRASDELVARAAALLGTRLMTPDGRARYADQGSVCLRHLATAWPHLDAAGRACVRDRALATSALLRWRLQEATRKDSWAVRYEPRGAELTAWRDALTAVTGTVVEQRQILGPSGGEPAPAL